jgi:hypothetical protein
MAVHVPLSLEAQLEARVLMMSTNNILSPANGRPIIVPSQDIVLGLYYLSQSRENEPGEGKIFADLGEIEAALDAGVVTLHSRVKARFSESNAEGKVVRSLIETTPGRMKIAALLPQHPAIGHRLVAKPLTKKEIGNLIDIVYRHCGQKATVIFADQIMGLGFKEAAKAGISFGKDDIIIPESKKKIVADTRSLVEEYEQQYADGLITKGEKYNKVVDAWAKSTDLVADAMMGDLGAMQYQCIVERGRGNFKAHTGKIVFNNNLIDFFHENFFERLKHSVLSLESFFFEKKYSSILSAISSVLSGLNKYFFILKISGKLERLEEMQGAPADMASNKGNPNPSSSDGKTYNLHSLKCLITFLELI